MNDDPFAEDMEWIESGPDDFMMHPLGVPDAVESVRTLYPRMVRLTPGGSYRDKATGWLYSRGQYLAMKEWIEQRRYVPYKTH